MNNEMVNEIKARRTFRHKNRKRNHLQILDGILATHYHSLENSWELILRTWVPPFARVHDATAGPCWMWRNFLEKSTTLDESSSYIFTFSDIEPQQAWVDKVPLENLYLAYDSNAFDAVILDPPYRRNLKGAPYDVQKFKGDQRFDLDGFIHQANIVIPQVLKPNGKLILKIGDSRIDGKFEPWDMLATTILTNFTLEDRVFRRPFYFRKRVMGANGRATLIHEAFLLYSLKSDQVKPV